MQDLTVVRSVYKSRGVVYFKDSAGTWEVSKGLSPSPYSIGREFLFRLTWVSTDTMTKYGDYYSYEDMIQRIRSIS